MARPRADVRLARILNVIPWVVDRQGATIEEIAERFDIPMDEVVADLSLVQCCEIPPYGPDNTLGIAVVDDQVLVEPNALLSRPLRLTPAEAVGLLAAGRAAEQASPDPAGGALASALAKLEKAIGGRAPMEVDLEAPEVLSDVAEAIRNRHRLRIEYLAAYSDEVTDREIDPLRLTNTEGHWYLAAWCHRAGDLRVFRLDRIRELEVTAETFDPALGEILPPDEMPPLSVDRLEVVLDVPTSARWVSETYPVHSVDESPEGRLRIRMGITGRVFLERLLLRLGPEARVVSPPELAEVGREAAAEVLARYSR